MTSPNPIEQDTDSGYAQLDALRNTANAQGDLTRIERKLDRLTDAVSKLVLVEERQANQSVTIAELRLKVFALDELIDKIDKASNVRDQAIEKKVDQWINRGIGVWALAIVLYGLAQFVLKLSH